MRIIEKCTLKCSISRNLYTPIQAGKTLKSDLEKLSEYKMMLFQLFRPDIHTGLSFRLVNDFIPVNIFGQLYSTVGK